MRATSPAVIAAVAADGALGALGRHLVNVLAGGDWSHDVLATLAVNLVGAFGLGILVSVMLHGADVSAPVLRGFLVTGLLGGFTTFSAVALQVRDGVVDGRAVATAAYVVVTLVAGPLLARLGLAVGHRPPPRLRGAVEEPV